MKIFWEFSKISKVKFGNLYKNGRISCGIDNAIRIGRTCKILKNHVFF